MTFYPGLQPHRLFDIFNNQLKVLYAKGAVMNGNSAIQIVREIHKSHAPYSGGHQCGGGGCPAVYETDQGTYLVVGRRLSAEEKATLSMDAIEDALEVPGELLASLVRKLQQ